MVPNSVMFRIASSLTVVGIVLALANWHTKPESGLAWAAALAMMVVMLVVLRLTRPAARPFEADASAARSLDRIPTAVVFAALMMGIPLALTLARAYGFGDGSDVARRSTGVLIAAFLVMLGNVMPKNLPPLSSGCDGARQQAFHRLAGWTWVLCGLGSAAGWIALPVDVAEATSAVLVVTAIALSIVHLVRLTRRARTTPPMN